MQQLARKAQRGFSVFAVILSLLFSFVAGAIALISLNASMGEDVFTVDPVQWRASHDAPDEREMPPYSRKFLLVFLALSVLVDVAAGYIAGRVGKDAPVFHAVVAGVVLLAFSMLMRPPVGHDPFPAWFGAVAYLGTLPLMIIGGWMASED